MELCLSEIKTKDDFWWYCYSFDTNMRLMFSPSNLKSKLKKTESCYYTMAIIRREYHSVRIDFSPGVIRINVLSSTGQVDNYNTLEMNEHLDTIRDEVYKDFLKIKSVREDLKEINSTFEKAYEDIKANIDLCTLDAAIKISSAAKRSVAQLMQLLWESKSKGLVRQQIEISMINIQDKAISFVNSVYPEEEQTHMAF